MEHADLVDTLTQTHLRAESEKCHLCHKPIIGAQAIVWERVIGFTTPHYARATVQHYHIRAHFINALTTCGAVNPNQPAEPEER